MKEARIERGTFDARVWVRENRTRARVNAMFPTPWPRSRAHLGERQRCDGRRERKTRPSRVRKTKRSWETFFSSGDDVWENRYRRYVFQGGCVMYQTNVPKPKKMMPDISEWDPWDDEDETTTTTTATTVRHSEPKMASVSESISLHFGQILNVLDGL